MSDIPTQYDFQPGGSLLSLSSITKEQLLQALSQMAPLSNIGGVIYADGTSYTPTIALNPRFERYLWLDADGINLPTLKSYNPTLASWQAISLSAGAVNESHIAVNAVTVYDDDVGVLKKIALAFDGSAIAGWEGRALRVDSTATNIEAVPINTLISNNALTVTAIGGGTDNQFIRKNGANTGWETISFDTEINNLAAGVLDLDKINAGGGSASWLVRVNSAGTALESINNNDSSSNFLPALSIAPTKLASGGAPATAGYILRWSGTVWEAVDPPLGFTGTSAFSTTGYNTGTFIPSTGLQSNSYPHGFGATPKLVRVVALCELGDLGYLAGEEVDITSMFWDAGGGGGGFPAVGISCDSTNIVISSDAIGGGQSRKLYHKSGSSYGTIAANSWKYKIYAWK